MVTKAETSLIVFQKNPVLGKVKTRLAVSIGDEEALSVYLQLLDITHQVISKLENVEKRIYFSDVIDEYYLTQPNTAGFIQQGCDLGEKMHNAFRETFEAGYRKVIIIGTDCPSITTEILNASFEKLEKSDIVIGPAFDGGYYLLGMNSFYPELFIDIPWSTYRVTELSLHAAKSLKLSWKLLPELNDLDDFFDYELFKKTYLS